VKKSSSEDNQVKMAVLVYGMADCPKKNFTARMKVIILIARYNFVTLSEYEMCDYSVSCFFCIVVVVVVVVVLVVMAWGSIVGLGTMLQSRQLLVQVSVRLFSVFNLSNPS
jgi:hypothetical protein